MQHGLKSKMVRLAAGGVFGLALLADANAYVVPIAGSGVTGSGWEIVCPPTAPHPCSNGLNGSLSLSLNITSPALSYDFVFRETEAERQQASNFGLRTLGTVFQVSKSLSPFEVTGLHFTLIDPNTPAPPSVATVPAVHPAIAHYHLATPVLAGTASDLGTANPSNPGTVIDITGLSLLPGQNLSLTGGAAFGIHQYEVLGQNRSFILRVTADTSRISPVSQHQVPLPGTLALLSAGFLAMVLNRKKS